MSPVLGRLARDLLLAHDRVNVRMEDVRRRQNRSHSGEVLWSRLDTSGVEALLVATQQLTDAILGADT